MKKVLIVALTVMILYNAILPAFFNKTVAVSAPGVFDENDDTMQMPENMFEDDIMNNTTSIFKGEQRPIYTTASQGGALVTILFDVINVIPIACSTLMSIAAYPDENAENALNGGGVLGEVIVDGIEKWYTIGDTVFGKIEIFDIDYSKAGGGATVSTNKNNNMQTTQGSTQTGSEGVRSQTIDNGGAITRCNKKECSNLVLCNSKFNNSSFTSSSNLYWN